MFDNIKKKGRPRGSLSFINISLFELNKYLKEDAIVVVSVQYWKTIRGEKIEKQEKQKKYEENYESEQVKEKNDSIPSGISIEEF